MSRPASARGNVSARARPATRRAVSAVRAPRRARRRSAGLLSPRRVPPPRTPRPRLPRPEAASARSPGRRSARRRRARCARCAQWPARRGQPRGHGTTEISIALRRRPSGRPWRACAAAAKERPSAPRRDGRPSGPDRAGIATAADRAPAGSASSPGVEREQHRHQVRRGRGVGDVATDRRHVADLPPPTTRAASTSACSAPRSPPVARWCDAGQGAERTIRRRW